ncbi:solute carrier family 41 member 1 isoform X3 [Rhipicephalus microplus]|uniref:solute carrier family 41 member 1 isoform X3 n=1 Tax=Rhipicephalus microplus TaxID=6941 RepID=UPI00188751BA|nr:solute carrier family 41 member 1-like isoform X2 [Rhipicephalus microplus]
MASSSPGTRGAEQGTLNADMNNRNGVMAEYKHESRRASHDASHENVAFCNGHTRKDRSPEVVKPQQQVYSNSMSCHAPEGGSRRASVVCYRDGEECVFRKGICYSENCAALTDENLNESSAARLKPEDDCSARKKRSLVASSSEESLLSIFKQAAVPFFLGGLGTVFAGLILDTVQFWPPFEHVTELFIVVPPLLGLKGNLEMTLAARLSTQANLGNMDSPRKVWHIAVGNMALVQCQACVLSLLSSVFAIIMGLASDDAFRIDQALFVASSSMATAAVASFLLAKPWISSVFGTVLVVLCPAWVYIARGHPTSRKVLAVGWWPIIVAMIISSIGGYILDLAVTHFSGLAVFQPVINGVNGNLAAIHASRLSTLFAQRSELGFHPEDDKRHCVDPLTGLCGNNRQARVSQLLLLLSIPGHVLFVLLIFAISDAHVRLTVALVFSYLVASIVLLTLLLYMARCGAYWMWRRKIDPDNALIPLLTGFGDLCGTGFLLLAFLFLESIEDDSVAGFGGLATNLTIAS